jgi:thioredoxin 1
MAKEVTDATFEAEVLNSGKPAVVDFWAIWCGPCRMITPIIEELSIKYADQVVVAKVDVDTNPATASKFSVRNIPTVLFIKDGVVVDKQVGAASKNVFEQKLKAIL